MLCIQWMMSTFFRAKQRKMMPIMQVFFLFNRVLYKVRQTPLFFENALKKLLNIFSNFFFHLKVQSFRLIMENNILQMADSAGHAHYRLYAAVFHQWLQQYYPLKLQLSLACRHNTHLSLTAAHK